VKLQFSNDSDSYDNFSLVHRPSFPPVGKCAWERVAWSVSQNSQTRTRSRTMSLGGRERRLYSHVSPRASIESNLLSRSPRLTNSDRVRVCRFRRLRKFPPKVVEWKGDCKKPVYASNKVLWKSIWVKIIWQFKQISNFDNSYHFMVAVIFCWRKQTMFGGDTTFPREKPFWKRPAKLC